LFLNLHRRRVTGSDGREFFRPPPGPTEAFAALLLPGWPSRRAMDMIFHG
jgi:hypothetical protein